MASTTSKDAVHINDGDSDQVVLHPQDNDVFVRTGKQAIEACRLGISIELWLEELKSMLAKVRTWTEQRATRVRACYCSPHSRVLLFFVPMSDRFDFDLADELAVLHGELVKGFNIGMVELRQIPEAEIDRFLDLDTARLVYGQLSRSHQAMEAQS